MMKPEDLEGFDEYSKQPNEVAEIDNGGNSWLKYHSKIVSELGMVPALIFGAIESYSRMDSGLCYASQSRIASRVSVTRETVNITLPKLIAAGYIEDLTPGRRNSPHKLKILWNSGVN